jgi:dipeptidyl aminopeptidase/acylaminoacyl peptidase
MSLRTRFSSLAAIVCALSGTAGAQQASGPTKQMQAADLKAWKGLRQSTLSNDGKWFAYVVAPNEGNATLVLRSTGTDNKETKFPIGEAGGGRAGPPPGIEVAAGAAAPVAISGDSKWLAYTIYPQSTAGQAGRGGRGGAGRGGAPQAQGAVPAAVPTQNKLGLVNILSGEKKEFDRVRRFAFNGDKPTWIAMQSYPEAAAPAANAGGAAGNGRGGGAPAGGGGAAGRPDGTDLVLYNLSTGDAVNVGNVAEFAFDDSGDWLAYTIDARDQIGNGVQLRNMRTDVVRGIDSERALYRRLVWNDSVGALAVLRGMIDSTARDTLFSIVTFTKVATGTPVKAVFDPAQHSDFPSTMKIAADRAPRLTDDLSAVFFAIRAQNPRTPATVAANGRGNVVQAGAPGEGGTRNQPANQADELPSLVLWHNKDPRLQSQQITQESQDRAFSYLAEYRFGENKFVRLVDDDLRTVTTTGHDHFAYGIDTREYDQPAAYTGRRYEDVYSVDLRTGARTPLVKKHIPSAQLASPDGKELLYWGDDAQYWVLDLVTGQKRNITKSTAINFANTDDDHNNLVPPPRFPLGWVKDGSAVLLSDGWDIWKVPTRGAASAVNLTVNGKKDQIRYQRLYAFDRTTPGGGGRGGRGGGRGGAGGAADGIDLSQPLYIATYGEWTKKAGLSRVDPNTPGAKQLVWEDATFNFEKAKEADVYLYTRQSSIDYPNYYVANADFKGGRQITDVNPQQKDFAWSSGVKLINYTSAKGDKLQGALYLPANYQPGKKYPLLVTIYEKRSNLANTYVGPSETSTPNRSMYTSRGYAVLDPDIVYRVNDPMMSAVWCVVPAVKAAIASGIVDSANVGVWGHSWGGSEAGFLVTQTNIFKAAIAGAPLTNMVSMYASVYWNTGGSDAAIFESSQGRFKGNFIENSESYIRNSSVFHADKVKTPLIILADDKDGAVDFNQGITYYNTLAQLKKDVILLEYVGENHGLARPVNMKDYQARQREWFDHYLMGAAAPDWITKGIARIKLEDELKARRDAAGSIVP